MSLIGIIALCGIVVNNAILAVDTARRLRAEGWPGRAAVLEAARLRLRPILMTTLTTVVGMIPMAIGLGSGEQVQQPLAIAIMGGLSVGTFVTLFLTPALYEAAHRRRRADWLGPPPPGGDGA
jgi:multidrug efflux pump subunit AcrB